MTYCTFLEGDQAENYKADKKIRSLNREIDDNTRAARRGYSKLRSAMQNSKNMERQFKTNQHAIDKGYNNNKNVHDIDITSAIERHDRRHPNRKIVESGIFANIELI